MAVLVNAPMAVLGSPCAGSESRALVQRRRHRARLVAFAPACLWGTPNHVPQQTAASHRAMPLRRAARPTVTMLARHTEAHAHTHDARAPPPHAPSTRFEAGSVRQDVPVHDADVGGGSLSLLSVSAAAAPCAPTAQATAAMASSAVRVGLCLRLCNACTMITASSATLQRTCRRQALQLWGTTVRPGKLHCGGV